MTDEVKAKTPFLAKIASDKVFCYMSMALLVFLPVAEIITEFLKSTKNKAFRFMYPSYFQPYIVAVFGIAGTLMVILSMLARATGGKKFKLYVADIFYFTLLIFMLLSMIFSVNFGVFADGLPYYMEHPLHFLCYYSLFYAGTMIEDSKLRKKLLISYLIVAVIEGIVAFLQTLGIEILYCLFIDDKPAYNAAYGTIQNTNFYGALSCLLTAAVSGLFIFSSKLFKSKVFKWIIYAAAMFIFYTMLSSGARQAWVGLTAMIFMYIVSLVIMRKSNIDRKYLKNITRDFIIVLVGYVAVIIINLLADASYITNRIEQTVQDTATAIGDDDFGSGRGAIWKAALSSVPHHWATGIGLDNLTQAFREMPGWKQGDYVQAKGHCEYIHTLATQGVFAITNYVLLIIYAGVTSVKAIFNEKDDVKRGLLWIFFGMFTAYISLALFSNSVMNVAPYYWLVLGIVTQRTKPISFKKK